MDRDLPLEAHLGELRSRLLICLIPLLLLIVPAFLVTPLVLPYIFAPLDKWGYTIHFYQLTDGLMLRIRLALFLDLTLLSPLILAEAVLFAWPGLLTGERRALITAVGLAGILFCAGAALFILVLTPWLVDLWQSCGNTGGTIISGTRYYTVWQSAALVFGLVSCLPVLLLLRRRLHKAQEGKQRK
jgi:sec-independent protein translocase protein TatC